MAEPNEEITEEPIEFRMAVKAVTGEFLYGHASPYDVEPGLSPTQIRVVTDRWPNPRLERYSGDPESPIREATSEELAAYDAARGVDIRPVALIRALREAGVWGRLRKLDDDEAIGFLDEMVAWQGVMNTRDQAFIAGASAIATAAVSAGIFANLQEATTVLNQAVAAAAAA
jgi:hypothetical protein